MHAFRRPSSCLRAPLGALVALVTALLVAGSALAGGGPGGPPPAVSFTPGAFVLDVPSGQVTFTGTLSCTRAASATLYGTLIEPLGKKAKQQASGSTVAVVDCPSAGDYPVTMTYLAETHRGFRTGPVELYQEVDYDTVPDETGTTYPGSVFGMIPGNL